MGRMPCAALSAGARDGLMACSDLADNGPLPYTPTCTRYEQMPCPCLPSAYPYPSPARQRSMRRPCRERKHARTAAWRREPQGFEGSPTVAKARKRPKILPWFVPCPLAAHPAAVLISLAWLRKVPHGVVALPAPPTHPGAQASA